MHGETLNLAMQCFKLQDVIM